MHPIGDMSALVSGDPRSGSSLERCATRPPIRGHSFPLAQRSASDAGLNRSPMAGAMVNLVERGHAQPTGCLPAAYNQVEGHPHSIAEAIMTQGMQGPSIETIARIGGRGSAGDVA
ncbi:hypothetical protein CLAIMM_09958 [Cladophialophora immunda]|nr:hypothetical protein CLAIMM_09958 [Cladophialophora immunda]